MWLLRIITCSHRSDGGHSDIDRGFETDASRYSPPRTVRIPPRIQAVDLTTEGGDAGPTFYKREKNRLPACPSTLHALLHVADSIEHSCPTRVNATWQLEKARSARANDLQGSRRADPLFVPVLSALRTCLLIETMLSDPAVGQN